MSIKLGQQVRDAVTGLTGIAVSIHTYMQGCRRITIQPPMAADGKVPDPYTVDEHQLEVVSDGLMARVDPAPPAERRGGPARFTDEGRGSVG